MRTYSSAIVALSAGADVLFIGLAAPAGAAETSWGDTPEPGVHLLLRDLVRETRAHRLGVRDTRGERSARTGARPDARCARPSRRHDAREADTGAAPPP